jgi:DNA-3-methyladenine glycosylase II
MPPDYWSEALSGLSKQDPVLKALIRNNRRKILQSRDDPFVTLARAIIGQQISVKAAATVWQRLLDAAAAIKPASVKINSVKPPSSKPASVKQAPTKSASKHSAALEPGAIAQMSIEQLRACGLSGRKSTYLVELANHFLDDSLDTENWRLQEDEQLIEELTKIKGIGR